MKADTGREQLLPSSLRRREPGWSGLLLFPASRALAAPLHWQPAAKLSSPCSHFGFSSFFFRIFLPPIALLCRALIASFALQRVPAEGGGRKSEGLRCSLARQPLPFSSSRGLFYLYTVHIPQPGALLHAGARGGWTPSQVGWGLPSALLGCTRGAGRGLGCSPAPAQPCLSF